MSATIARVRALLYLALDPKRVLRLVGGILGAAVYVWFAAVRAVPGVHARKEAAREAWRQRERPRP
jgi:hypothetical protein